MKKIVILLVLVPGLITSCASKTVTWNEMGQKSVITKTDAAAFSAAQEKAWNGYYEALKNPPVIATITQPSGDVIKINSQVPPPAPVIRQHQNQYIGPMTSVMKTGIKFIGGGLVIREIADSIRGTTITNTGSGTVTVDKSESVNVETNHAENGGTLNQGSNNDSSDNSDNSDNHVENADPVIVEQERVQVVEKEIVHEVRPEIVRPEVIVVDTAGSAAESE